MPTYKLLPLSKYKALMSTLGHNSAVENERLQNLALAREKKGGVAVAKPVVAATAVKKKKPKKSKKKPGGKLVRPWYKIVH